jgi:SAM-dependent methyltransferase
MSADTVLWHDVECGAYATDLPLWRQLAEASGGAVLDVGCGTGRVALDLARQGHEVTGIDSDPAFVRTLRARARREGLAVRAEIADARAFDLRRPFALAIAPMQTVQLLGGGRGRAAMLQSVHSHLVPGGRFAVALADPFEGEPAGDAGLPVPDVREREGWVYSSMPIAVRTVGESTAIDRVRQAVSPDGELSESFTTVLLDAVTGDQLEEEARALGFEPLPRRTVPPSGDYVGSSVVVLEVGP